MSKKAVEAESKLAKQKGVKAKHDIESVESEVKAGKKATAKVEEKNRKSKANKQEDTDNKLSKSINSKQAKRTRSSGHSTRSLDLNYHF